MWSRIIRFEILFVAAGSLLVAGIAYFFEAACRAFIPNGRNASRLSSLI
jgi:hypothetical protein